MAAPPFTPRRLIRQALRRARKLHDDLVYRAFCNPDKGIVGSCDPVEPGPYERHALGTRPACRWCHRETRL